ncbi:MAG TPA: ABC transporter permease, partial [Firmicutes bacterium]|nr:ABC transporter permease [Bacillota bacterium]
WAISFLIRTRLGQQMRAVGQDMHIAEVAGINVNRTRTVALVISTVLAAWGQLIFLQNIGTMNTYNSHEQVGTFAIAALLVGGATTRKATIWNAIVGVLLFHTLFIVSPLAGQKLLGIPQVGEYFRVFLAYGVIAVALALHAWQAKVKSNKELRGE